MFVDKFIENFVFYELLTFEKLVILIISYIIHEKSRNVPIKKILEEVLTFCVQNVKKTLSFKTKKVCDFFKLMSNPCPI